MDSTAPWTIAFLEALRRTGIVASACRAAGMSYSAAYLRRRADADFAAAWDEALEEAVDSAEAEAWRRGVHGYDEPVIYQGVPTLDYERGEHGEILQDTVLMPDGTTQLKPRVRLDENGRPRMLTIRKHSDALLALVLKGRRKKVFADRTELTGADGAPVQVDDTTRAARAAQLLAIAQRRKDYGDIV